MTEGILNTNSTIVFTDSAETAPAPRLRRSNRSLRISVCRRARRYELLFLLGLRLSALSSALSGLFSPLSLRLVALAGLIYYFASSAGTAALGAFYTLSTASRNAALALSLRHTEHPRSRARAVILLCMAVSILFMFSVFTFGIEVTVNGEFLGVVSSQAEMENAILSVSSRATELLGTPYVLNPDVSYRFALTSRAKVFDPGEVETLLFRQISGLKELYVLTVNGTVVGANSDEAALRSVISSFIAAYPNDIGASRTEIAGDVQVSRQIAAAASERSTEWIAARLTSNLREAQYYTMGEGDTLESVAARFGLSVKDLSAQNDLEAIEAFSSDSALSLLVREAIPTISVAQYFSGPLTEEVPYQTVEIEDPNLPLGTLTVDTEGVAGLADLIADITYLNGKEIYREVLSYKLRKEPVNKIVLRGTKVKAPTGTYIRPLYGTLTSDYGRRKLFGQYEYHPGLDIASPSGSPVVASDGGTVSFSGVLGGYGNCVIIDHGNGLQTLYGHNSKLLVKKGQDVAQGETIALVGSTGRSTGPHLHFEVRVNGSDVSPWKYIKKW